MGLICGHSVPVALRAAHRALTCVVARTLPLPPCLGTALRKNRPLVPRSNSRTTSFYHGIGFFMVKISLLSHTYLYIPMPPDTPVRYACDSSGLRAAPPPPAKLSVYFFHVFFFSISYCFMSESPKEGTTAQTTVTHEEQAAQLAAQIPNFFDADLVAAYRPVYLTADYLFTVGTRAPFLVKYIVYKLLLPENYFLIRRISTSYPPAIAFQLIQSLGL